MCAGWVLTSNGDTGACSVEVDYKINSEQQESRETRISLVIFAMLIFNFFIISEIYSKFDNNL